MMARWHRLLRKNIAIVSLSIGGSDFGQAWGIRASVLGFHFGVEINRRFWLHVWIAAWPWSARFNWSRAWFPRSKDSIAFFEKR